MKKTLIVLLLLSASKLFSQQNFNSEDLTVTKADVEINSYEKDSTANALIIYEHGNSYLDKTTFKLKTEVKRKLKILNREGFDNATVIIYLYNNDNKKEKVHNITGTTYNLEDNHVTRTQLDKSQIFEEKHNDQYTIVKFTFPNIKEGSVITYSYTLESPFMFKYKEWYFQGEIPKLYSQYNASIPGNYEYNIKLVGFLKFAVEESKITKRCLELGGGASAECADYIYVMKDIPAFIEEEYMTTKHNYLARIEYELKTFKGFDGTVDHYTKSWKIVDKELKTDKEIGKQLTKSSALKGLLDATIQNEKDPLLKAKAIYRFVQQTYTWNNKFDIFKDVSIKDLIDTKSGKVSEINILLHNLLDENDIDVKPVLLSTRNNGFVTKIYPVLSDFNYLIVQATINDKSYLLDATDDYLAFGELPFRCLNQSGRLLDFKDGSYWIDINAENTSTIQIKAELHLDANSKLSGSIARTTSGYHALPVKEAFFDKKEEYLTSFTNKYASIELLEHKAFTEDKTDIEFKEEFIIEQKQESVGDKIYLNPFLMKFFSENLFKLQERTYPIDFGFKDAYLYTFKLQIDDNFEILEKPQDMTLKLPNETGTATFTSKIENNTVQVYLKFNFNNTIYNPEYYKYIKAYMGSIVDIQKNSLIVIKKNS